MNKSLSKKDYIDIIDYYNNKSYKNPKNPKNPKNTTNIKRSSRIKLNKLNKETLRVKESRMLSNKFCRCIKLVSKNESKSIPICKKSVFRNKGLSIGKFTCKTRKLFTIKKYKNIKI